jgi:hypothetical protein
MKRLVNMILAFALAVGVAGCAGSHAGMNGGMGSKDAGMHNGMVSKDAKMKCPKCGATFTVEEGQKALDGP